jgi:hypothetical protein
MAVVEFRAAETRQERKRREELLEIVMRKPSSDSKY